MIECYWCARDLRRGHHGGCPALELSEARLRVFLGLQLAVRHQPRPLAEIDTQPDLPKVSVPASRGYIQGDRLL